jgi:hypothetical protein
MMLFEFGDSAPVIGDQSAMPRESELDIEIMNAVQTLKVALKGILNFGPALNIGGDIDQNMIARNQYLLFLLVQTGMAEAVPRGMP